MDEEAQVLLTPWPLSYVPPKSLRLPGYSYSAEDGIGLAFTALGQPAASLVPLQPKPGRLAVPPVPQPAREEVFSTRACPGRVSWGGTPG